MSNKICRVALSCVTNAISNLLDELLTPPPVDTTGVPDELADLGFYVEDNVLVFPWKGGYLIEIVPNGLKVSNGRKNWTVSGVNAAVSANLR